MTDRELYRIWAPLGKKWTPWVKPVPFVEMQEHSKEYNLTLFEVPGMDFPEEEFADAALIVDLPGAESIEVGIALAKEGYRPIPAFNGTIEQPGSRSTVDNQLIGMGLIRGAEELQKITLKDDARPVFLLDSNRLHMHRIDVTVFDNSWDVYPQDMPTADYFLKNGICKIVVIGERLSRDLKKILYEYQKKKIVIYFQKGYEEPKKVRLRKPLPIDVE